MKRLNVMLWGQAVGDLCWDRKRNTSYFIYDENFRRTGPELSPVTAAGDRLIWASDEKIYQKLPEFLSDSLPDAWGNVMFDEWARQHNMSRSEITPLEKLSFIGKRGMGAFEFVPDSGWKDVDGKVDISALSSLAERILQDRGNVSLQGDDALTMKMLIRLGTSAGGRQAKAVIAVNRRTGEIRSGQIDNGEDFDYHIIKFQDKSWCSSEVEMAYHLMAKAAGIRMNPCGLIEVEGTRHFTTLRFDRESGRKIHIQTLAAIAPQVNSYEGLINTCRILNVPESDVSEAFRRMIFNHLTCNTDDHNKNFSFLMAQDGKWRLSPAYDLTFIRNIGGYLPELMHSLSANGSLDMLSLDGALQFAERNGIRSAKKIIDEVVSSVSQFNMHAAESKIPSEWVSRISHHLNENLQSWGYGKRELRMQQIGEDCMDNIEILLHRNGNIAISLTFNGTPRVVIIRKGTNLHGLIMEKGLDNIPEDDLKNILLVLVKENGTLDAAAEMIRTNLIS